MTGEELLAQKDAGEWDFIDADLHGADLRGADLVGINLSGSNLSGANLSGAFLCEVNFSNTNLSGADLSGADLTDAIFTDANLTGANLSDTILAPPPPPRTYTRNITQTSICETIRNKAEVDKIFKESKGGSGSYAHVKLTIRPASDAPPTQFVSKHIINAANNVTLYICVADSVIIKDYQSGIVAAAKAMKGQLAGYPLRDVAIQVIGGQMHDVDSNPLAFEKATALALQEALNKAHPFLIEPIYKIVTSDFQEEYMGDTVSLINRYGAITGMDSSSNNKRIVEAIIPYRLLSAFEQDCKQVSHSDGQFDAEFYSYENVRREVAEQLIAKK
jgi:hypothetical protein